MRTTLNVVVRASFVVMLSLISGGLFAFGFNDLPSAPEGPSTLVVPQDDLQQIQDQLDLLKQQVSVATDYGQWVVLKDAVQQLITEADVLATSRLPERTQVLAQLDVLGPVPVAGAATETTAVAQQRVSLLSRRAQLESELKQLEVIKESAVKLAIQITGIRRAQLESQLTLQSPSVLSPRFWSPLFSPSREDRLRRRQFFSQAAVALHTAWQPEQRTATLTFLLMAVLLGVLGRPLVEKGFTRYCVHRLPEGRLRRSSLAVSTVLGTLLTLGGAFELILRIFTRQPLLATTLDNFLEEFETLALTTVLILGLSRALLSTERPSWRLPAIPDPVALAMKHYPMLFVASLLVVGGFLRMGSVIGISLEGVILGRGVLALAMVVIVGAAFVRTDQVRRAMEVAGNPPDPRTTFVGLLHACVWLVLLVTLAGLLFGYISFSTFVTYEFVWFYIVLTSYYLLSRWVKDICESVFSHRHASGKAIQQLLRFGDMQLEQTSIVVSGAAKALLLLLAGTALVVGGLGARLGELVDRTLAVLGGEWLRQLDIVPGHFLNAILLLVIGWYLVRSLRRWLDGELMPKTEMDPGMRASLSTLFGNIGYTSVGLLALYALGVKWSNLAWIVSALSVGIGFGLQEIVKNFVSGLILLTERPVKVGDLVSIGGVEGDIRRINVRATEIQLSDRSIVIVPNSQLISQNLRNITMGGNAQGVAILELTFAPNIDPAQVKTLLLEAYLEHEDILERPVPSVRFIQLTSEGVLIRVTGYVSSPRVVGHIKSELIFEILQRLNAAGVLLTNAQP